MPKKKKDAQGSHGSGKYYRIIVRPKQEFISFKVHDAGNNGDAEQLTGKRDSGSWATHAWLINKKAAHVEKDRLIGDSNKARTIIESLSSIPERVRGDIFRAKDVKKYGLKKKEMSNPA